jgi:hypothetical protein
MPLTQPRRLRAQSRTLRLICAWSVLCLSVTACKPADAPRSGAGEGSAAPTGPVHAPRLTPDKMPPGFDGLVLGQSDEAALTKLLGEPSKREADTSLGGDMGVSRNDVPAIALYWKTEASLRRELSRQQLPEAAQADAVKRLLHRLPTDGPFARYEEVSLTLTPAAKGAPPTLYSLYLRATSPAGGPRLCAQLHDLLGQDPESTRCPGTNRRFSGSKDGFTYCVGDAAGEHNVFVECHTGEGANADIDSLEVTLSR